MSEAPGILGIIMRTLIDLALPVAYGQFYVRSDDGDLPDAWRSMGGQQNGLCGAALPGSLFLVTGLHTGRVAFTAELHASEPAPGEEWEEIVEASFRPLGETFLEAWGGDFWPLDLADADYRVRYLAIDMHRYEGDEDDDDFDSFDPEEEPPCVGRYLLQFWPAPPAPDLILRQTSAAAAYWHANAREQPPPSTSAE